jgi:hypothetical protein
MSTSKSHTVAIDVGQYGRAWVYVRPGIAAYRDWYTVYPSAAEFATVGEAQDWLERVIGFKAEDYEIHRRHI